MARYLSGTRDVELLLIPGMTAVCADGVHAYVDADWADKEDRRSTSGGMLFYHGCLVSSWSRRQGCVALSTAESELYALGAGAIEALGFASMLAEWHEICVPTLHSDSQSALHVVKRRGPGRMKHMEIRTLALQDWRQSHRLQVAKVPTEDNPSDILTKVMPQERLARLGAAVGLVGGPFGRGRE